MYAAELGAAFHQLFISKIKRFLRDWFEHVCDSLI